jgi:hypothetical protein
VDRGWHCSLKGSRFLRASRKQTISSRNFKGPYRGLWDLKSPKNYLWILRLIVCLLESRRDKFDVCVELEWLVLLSKVFPEGVTGSSPKRRQKKKSKVIQSISEIGNLKISLTSFQAYTTVVQ